VAEAACFRGLNPAVNILLRKKKLIITTFTINSGGEGNFETLPGEVRFHCSTGGSGSVAEIQWQ
jgi:hypothetical protein